MASQIAHVVYGKKIFTRLNNGLNWEDYLIGTLFPDIRYLAKIDRKITHQTFDKFNKEKSSFEIGVHTHLIVDKKREDYIVKSKVYDLLPESIYNATALKLIEDKITYDRISNWTEISTVLNKYPQGEFEYGILKDVVFKWHKLLKFYFKSTPTRDIWRKLLHTIGYDDKIVEKIFSVLDLIEDNKTILDVIKQTYQII